MNGLQNTLSYCSCEAPSFIQTVWEVADTNLVSSILGSLIFAIVTGLILHNLIGKRERKSLSNQVSLILTQAIKENLETHDILLGQLNEGSISMVPDPFHIVPLQIILQGKFVEVMSPELVNEVAVAQRYCTIINSNYARLFELRMGSASALVDSPAIRQSLMQECILQMPGLKQAHLNIRRMLKKSKK